MAGNVPDWRHQAKGAHHYLDEAAELERNLGAAISSARVRVNTGMDPSSFILEAEQGLRRMRAIPPNVLAEMRMLDNWIESETQGFFGRSTAPTFRAQFDEQYEIYNLVLSGMTGSLQHFNSELATLGQP